MTWCIDLHSVDLVYMFSVKEHMNGLNLSMYCVVYREVTDLDSNAMAIRM
jgi:hypothetical protein